MFLFFIGLFLEPKMKSIFLLGLLTLFAYIKSIELYISNLEIGFCPLNGIYHFLFKIESNDTSVTINSLTMSNINNQSKTVEAECDITSQYCSFSVDTTDNYIVTKYDGVTYDGTSSQIQIENPIDLSTITFSSEQQIYKNFQKYVNFTYPSTLSASSLFFNTMFTIRASSNSMTEGVPVSCEESKGVLACLFEMNNFNTNRELVTFTFTSKCQNVQNVSMIISLMELSSISNGIGISNTTIGVHKNITLNFTEAPSDDFMTHLKLNNNLTTINMSPFCKRIKANIFNCTLRLVSRRRYVMYYDENPIDDSIVLYDINYFSKNSLTTIRVGTDIYVKTLFTLTFTPLLYKKDVSVVNFTSGKNYFLGEVTDTNYNKRATFGVKYGTITNTGKYMMTIKIGNDTYSTDANNTIEVKPWSSKPQFVGYYDGDIRVGYNESYVTFQFNSSAKDISHMNMKLPIGGTVFNCSSITYQNNGQNIYTKKCNVTATKTGNAIFEYDIYGQRVTIPKEFEIVEYASSYYLIYSIVNVLLLFSIFL